MNLTCTDRILLLSDEELLAIPLPPDVGQRAEAARDRIFGEVLERIAAYETN